MCKNVGESHDWLNLFIQFYGGKAGGVFRSLNGMGWLKVQRVGLALFEER